MLVVRQPDGTQSHVPEWMCLPAAAAASVCERPRFPLEALKELRLLVDAALSFGSDGKRGDQNGTVRGKRTKGSVRGGDEGRHTDGGQAAAAAAPGEPAAGGDEARNGARDWTRDAGGEQ